MAGGPRQVVPGELTSLSHEEKMALQIGKKLGEFTARFIETLLISCTLFGHLIELIYIAALGSLKMTEPHRA